jgi:hypothetical protein
MLQNRQYVLNFLINVYTSENPRPLNIQSTRYSNEDNDIRKIFTGIYELDEEIIVNTPVDTLVNLYQTHPYLYSILEDKQVLDILSKRYNLKLSFPSFTDFIRDYDNKYYTRRCWLKNEDLDCLIKAASDGHKDIIYEYIKNHDLNSTDYFFILTGIARSGNKEFWDDIYSRFNIEDVNVDYSDFIELLISSIHGENIELFRSVFKLIEITYGVHDLDPDYAEIGRTVSEVSNINFFEYLLTIFPGIAEYLVPGKAAQVAHWNIVNRIEKLVDCDNYRNRSKCVSAQDILKSPDPEYIFTYLNEIGTKEEDLFSLIRESLENQRQDIARILLEKYAYLYKDNKRGMTETLFEALKQKYFRFATLFLKTFPSRNVNYQELFTYVVSVLTPNYEGLQWIIDNVDKNYIWKNYDDLVVRFIYGQRYRHINKNIETRVFSFDPEEIYDIWDHTDVMKEFLNTINANVNYNLLVEQALQYNHINWVIHYMVVILSLAPLDYKWNYNTLASLALKRRWKHKSIIPLKSILMLSEGVEDTHDPIDRKLLSYESY